jgi:hypothetical protein
VSAREFADQLEFEYLRRELLRLRHELREHERIHHGKKHGEREPREIRVIFGATRDLVQGGTNVATTPYVLTTKKGVEVKIEFLDAAGVDVSADVDPAAVSVSFDHPELLQVGTSPAGNPEWQAIAGAGVVQATINATDKQGTALPPIVQEVDIQARIDEPTQIAVQFGAVRDLP